MEKKNLIINKIIKTLYIFVLLSFSYIMVESLFQTCVFDSALYDSEVILYKSDNLIVNIISILIFFLLIILFKKKYKNISLKTIKNMELFLIVYVIILGIIWVFSVTSIPAADSYNVFETASGVVNGDYSPMLSNNTFYLHSFYDNNSYFHFYPFQLTFVFICEIVYRIFGTNNTISVQLINVICVCFAYVGILKITKYLFKNNFIQFMTVLLLIGCIQPILYVTFVYGNIIGMCFAIWAAYFLIKYFRERKNSSFLFMGLFLLIAIMAKYNYMIYLIAFIILIIIDNIKKIDFKEIVFTVLVVLSIFGAKNLIIKRYEQMAKIKFMDGVSQILYLDMGLNESSMAPGWYTTIAKDTYLRNKFNKKKANKEAILDIKNRINIFVNRPNYMVQFFSNKVLSQWNEPTYESIWISKTKEHINEVGIIGVSVYDGLLGSILEKYFNYYMQIVYLFFVCGIYFLITKRELCIDNLLLLLVLFGGFLYHLLFEGKSQYIFTYIILLLPYVSYALNELTNIVQKKIDGGY